MVEDYEHLAPDADFKIDPARRRRIARMREAIRRVEELRLPRLPELLFALLWAIPR